MGILESINLEVIDLGESPVRLGGMKVVAPLHITLHSQGCRVCSLHTRDDDTATSISGTPDHAAPTRRAGDWRRCMTRGRTT